MWRRRSLFLNVLLSQGTLYSFSLGIPYWSKTRPRELFGTLWPLFLLLPPSSSFLSCFRDTWSSLDKWIVLTLNMGMYFSCEKLVPSSSLLSQESFHNESLLGAIWWLVSASVLRIPWIQRGKLTHLLNILLKDSQQEQTFSTKSIFTNNYLVMISETDSI